MHSVKKQHKGGRKMNLLKKSYNKISSKTSIFAFLLLFILASIIFEDKNFLSFVSVQNLLRKASTDGGILALGMAYVILIGSIDLSVGSVLALSGALAAMVGNTNPVLGILVGLLTGLACGLLNGFMVTKMRISPWVATLAMLLGIRGVVFLITNKKAVTVTNDTMIAIANTNIFGIKSSVFIFVILTLISMYIAKYTKFGMSLYAVGGNEEAAKMMGLKVDWIKMKAFMMTGLFSGIAGILLASRLYAAQAVAGDTWETNAIASCALGGILLSGGVGKFSGAFFGVLIVSILNTIFNYLGNISSWWQNIIMGVLILISIGIQSEVFHYKKIKVLKRKAV
jgi:ribose/xylose/arabinose/galactoside ABC-type transport system permease subunit